VVFCRDLYTYVREYCFARAHLYLYRDIYSRSNLSITNIGLKLAPADAIVYLSAKNIITAFFSSVAPLVGGYLADFFFVAGSGNAIELLASHSCTFCS
jgi:hypothetical protein